MTPKPPPEPTDEERLRRLAGFVDSRRDAGATGPIGGPGSWSSSLSDWPAPAHEQASAPIGQASATCFGCASTGPLAQHVESRLWLCAACAARLGQVDDSAFLALLFMPPKWAARPDPPPPDPDNDAEESEGDRPPVEC